MTLIQRLLLWLCFAPLLATAQNSSTDLTLKGELTGKDHQTYRLVPFDVPPGTARISVEFDYTTRDARTTIDLGILGPDGFRGQDGFRGWSGGNKRRFSISATDATPSYLPGPIRAGQWSLLLGIPNIRAETQAQYTATIHLERDDTVFDTRPETEPPVRATAGWYRGDLHMHTAHSDGSCASQQGQRVPCPLFLTVATASERGLDFIAITDHNTMSHANAIRELQPYFDKLLLIPGREVTTFQGHANLFGTLDSFDFRVSSHDVPDWNALLADVERTRGVISINHPVRPSGEQCMGCGWTPEGKLDYSRMQAVEVVNGLDADTPYSGVSFWEQLLNRGYRLTAIGGSDNHDALKPAVDVAELSRLRDAAAQSSDAAEQLRRSSGAIGTPTTVVYAESLSQKAIVEAIRRGRVFIDVSGSRTRALEFSAQAGEEAAQMGESLAVARGTTLRFAGEVTAMAGGKVEIILDGKRAPLIKDPRITSAHQSFGFQWHSDGKPHWLRVDVRDEKDRLALIGNPIYVRTP